LLASQKQACKKGQTQQSNIGGFGEFKAKGGVDLLWRELGQAHHNMPKICDMVRDYYYKYTRDRMI
jgi:hypothetical protein